MKSEYQSILSAGIEKKYTTLEQEIMSDVVRRIQKAGKITSTADWQLQRYMVLGHSTEDVENIIRSAVGGDYVDTFRLYDEVIETEYVRSKATYEQVNAHFTPYEQNYELQQLTSALIQQSTDICYFSISVNHWALWWIWETAGKCSHRFQKFTMAIWTMQSL